MRSTRAWARSLGVSVAPTPPEVAGYTRKYKRTARQVAIRALILQGVVAVACGVEPAPVEGLIS
jgi:hypothetical protein